MMTRLALAFLLFALPATAAKTAQGPHAKVSLLGGETTPDGINFGVEFRLEPGWHIYWKNPGDSGAAPKFDFKIEGGEVSPPSWPVPERVRFNDLTNYGYHRRVVFPFTIKPGAGAKRSRVTLNLEYLVCKIECTPGFSTLEADYAFGPPTKVSTPLADPHYPLPSASSPFRLKTLGRSESGVKFSIQGERDLKNVREIDLFPLDGTLFRTRAPAFKEENGELTAEIFWDPNAKKTTEKTEMLLKLVDGGGVSGYEIPVSLATSGISWAEFGRALVFAFLGGLILNLMPCVFPVLSIKILTFVGESRSPAAARRGGWLYCAGIVGTFLALAGILLVLRASGEQLGWGFQLQAPAFVLAMALFFFIVGLNFLGIFDVGYGIMRWGGGLQLNSSFGTGVLATLVATPCTAPFMGAALGVSLLLPTWAALGIFAALGVGMALPFLLLSYFPNALERLPRPGAWMERLKQFFAFPLFGSTIWLGWVLVQQAGERGFLLLGFSMLGIALGAWAFRMWKMPGISVGALSIVLALVLVAPRNKSVTAWEPYRKSAIEKADVPIFIDFTAAWCLTCQWNKKAILDTEPVQALFAKNGVKLIRADWTDRDPAVMEALASYGRNSVPLYVFIPPQGKAILLPELISKEDIERLFPPGAASPKE